MTTTLTHDHRPDPPTPNPPNPDQQTPKLVPAPPRESPARVAVARAVTGAVLRRVPVRVVTAAGRPLARRARPLPPHAPAIEVRDPEALLRRIAAHPKLGIGDGYVAGEWREAAGTDLAAALLPFAQRLGTVVPAPLRWLRGLVDQPLPPRHRNTPGQARANIAAHYDLSNAMFAAFLDPTLSYSSALFDPEGDWAEQSLERAQLRKVRQILDLAGVAAGSRVLEIGTGWGTLAIEAARRGARVTTLTLSAEQAQLARQRIAEAGLADRVTVRLSDYRELAGDPRAAGSYDAIVSVEMIEAVGEEYWPVFWGTVGRLLAPGGVVAIQSILMSHRRYRATRGSHGWIQERIFPGGLIPSLRAIQDTAASGGDLRLVSAHRFGAHYAETLRRWRESFTAAWPALREAGFDEEFRRTWLFYLAYCQAGFASGYLDVAQLRLERER